VVLDPAPALCFDLGGGSLEVMVGDASSLMWATSVPLGVARLSADHIHSDPISKRDRRALRDHLEQLHVGRSEQPGRQGADVDDAEHLVVRDQRHPGHRLDPLLAENRVQHVGVVDVVEDDGPSIGGDSPREALAERDADAALDLFLDPLRGARDELVGCLVEKQKRSGVGVECVADAEQQLVEELVEHQVCERHVGDDLEPSEPFGEVEWAGRGGDHAGSMFKGLWIYSRMP
jgi:hypothetical protein